MLGVIVTLTGVYNTRALPLEQLLIELAQEGRIGSMVLVSRWASYDSPAVKTTFDDRAKYLVDEVTGVQTFLADSMARTVSEFKESETKIAVLGSVPEFPFNVPQAFARARLNRYKLQPLPLADFEARQTEVTGALRRASLSGATVIDVSKYLCDESSCHFRFDDKLIYSDDHHLNNFGAAYLSPMVIDALTMQQLPK